jgi:hypothetical protein
MFADRMQEDRVLASARPGLWDVLAARLADARFGRLLAAARDRVFAPGRELIFRLGEGKYLAMTGHRFCRVYCARGAVWVTVEGDARDRVLTPGQDLRLAHGGKMVISGRGENAEVKVQWD